MSLAYLFLVKQKKTKTKTNLYTPLGHLRHLITSTLSLTKLLILRALRNHKQASSYLFIVNQVYPAMTGTKLKCKYCKSTPVIKGVPQKSRNAGICRWNVAKEDTTNGEGRVDNFFPLQE